MYIHLHVGDVGVNVRSRNVKSSVPIRWLWNGLHDTSDMRALCLNSTGIYILIIFPSVSFLLFFFWFLFSVGELWLTCIYPDGVQVPRWWRVVSREKLTWNIWRYLLVILQGFHALLIHRVPKKSWLWLLTLKSDRNLTFLPHRVTFGHLKKASWSWS